MDKGAFQVTLDRETARMTFTLVWAEEGPVPPAQLKLVDEVREFLSIVRQLLTDQGEDGIVVTLARRFYRGCRRLFLGEAARPSEESLAKKRAYYLDCIEELCTQGLTGDRPQPDYAANQLKALEESFIAEIGVGLQRRYVMRLLYAAAIVMAPLVFLWVWAAEAWGPGFGVNGNELSHLSALLAASVFGAWLSYVTRREGVTFDGLSEWSYSWTEGFLRLIVVASVAFMFALMLDVQLMKIEVSELDSTKILSETRLALIFGLMFGVSERTLPTRVFNRARSLVGEKPPAVRADS